MLILRRNATRDYLDFVALADHMGDDRVIEALQRFDDLYPQESGESALQQLQVQLSNAHPFDLEEMKLAKYRNLDPKWHDWNIVKSVCGHLVTMMFDRVSDQKRSDR